MIYISHRGNINGADPERENTVDYVMEAVSQNFDVEVDVWFVDGSFYLGHDQPKEKVSMDFLRCLWCHAKTIDTLAELLKDPVINCFFHQRDDATLTSHGYIWAYPGIVQKEAILLKFEKDETFIIPDVKGICSDNINFYRDFEI